MYPEDVRIWAVGQGAHAVFNNRRRGSADTDVLTIVCECADPDCAQRIELDHGEYETARSEPTRFVVAPGHVEPEIEEVISRTERFELVRKVGVGREVATRLDSTSAGDSDPLASRTFMRKRSASANSSSGASGICWRRTMSWR